MSEASRKKMRGPFTEEHRRKLSVAEKGRVWSEERRKKVSQSLGGRKHSDEQIRKYIETRRGWKPSDETRKRMSDASKRRVLSAESLASFTAKMPRGERHWNWKGGITPLSHQLRNTPEYKEWRRLVFRSDFYVCGLCQKKGSKLQAHHIKTVSECPLLIFNVDNGISLCQTCHDKTRKHEKEFEEQFMQTIRERRKNHGHIPNHIADCSTYTFSGR